jgi:hypothetical protein
VEAYFQKLVKNSQVGKDQEDLKVFDLFVLS